MAGVPLESYLELVDATGRAARSGKRGVVPPHLRSILRRLDIDDSAWKREIGRGVVTGLFGTAVGSAANRAAEAIRRGTRWVTRVMDVYLNARDSGPGP